MRQAMEVPRRRGAGPRDTRETILQGERGETRGRGGRFYQPKGSKRSISDLYAIHGLYGVCCEIVGGLDAGIIPEGSAT